MSYLNEGVLYSLVLYVKLSCASTRFSLLFTGTGLLQPTRPGGGLLLYLNVFLETGDTFYLFGQTEDFL